MSEFPRPRNFSRERVLETVGDTKNFRNPALIEDVSGSWPSPHNERSRAYERMLGMEKGGPSAKRGPF